MEQERLTLIEAAKDDQESFHSLVEMYSPIVYRWCRRLTENAEDIKDIMQEAFIRLYLDLPKLQNIERFHGWFRKVVVHAAYDWFRKYRRKLEVAEIEQAVDVTGTVWNPPDRNSVGNAFKESIRTALERLSANNRIVFTLFYEQDKTCAEIAEMLHLSENAVKNRLHRAREQVKTELLQLPELQHLREERAFSVLILCGSHKKGGVSFEVAQAVEKSFLKSSPGSTVTIRQLAEFQLLPCRVCYQCERLRKCSLADDFNTIYEECLEADVIVVVSPYYAPIPSKLSAFLERLMSISIAPMAFGRNPGRAFPLQKKWCAVLNFSIVRQQGYMASIIREPLVSIGMGCILTEDKLPLEASIFEHGKLLGSLIIDTLIQKPDSNAIDNWFDYWNAENLNILDLVRQHERKRL
jgi:RNA polymerase sigma factor (sigma-70 family)